MRTRDWNHCERVPQDLWVHARSKKITKCTKTISRFASFSQFLIRGPRMFGSMGLENQAGGGRRYND